MNISNMLKQEAVNLGLCAGWTNEWGTPTKEQLVEMYLKGLDFCIKHDYPSNKFIKEQFGELAVENGVYTDMRADVVNPSIAVVNGKCTGVIVLDGFNSRDIHVRHDSRVRVIVRDYAKAFGRVYDRAKVEVIYEAKGRSFLYLKGGTGTVRGDG